MGWGVGRENPYPTDYGPKVLFKTCVAMKFVDDDEDDDDYGVWRAS